MITKIVVYIGNDEGYFKELVVGKEYWVVPSSPDYEYPPYYIMFGGGTYPQICFVDAPTTPTPPSQTHSAENNPNP